MNKIIPNWYNFFENEISNQMWQYCTNFMQFKHVHNRTSTKVKNGYNHTFTFKNLYST